MDEAEPPSPEIPDPIALELEFLALWCKVAARASLSPSNDPKRLLLKMAANLDTLAAKKRVEDLQIALFISELIDLVDQELGRDLRPGLRAQLSRIAEQLGDRRLFGPEDD